MILNSFLDLEDIPYVENSWNSTAIYMNTWVMAKVHDIKAIN